jgi:hypothetical protein
MYAEAYVTEEVFEVMTSGVVMSVQDGGVQVLLLMVRLSVVKLREENMYNNQLTASWIVLFFRLTHPAGRLSIV